jgi:hypothetical protein
MEGAAADQEQQMVALGVLIGAGAIVVGYIVKLLVPKKHFPWTAGVLASNVVVAAFAYAGVKIAGIILPPWLIGSILVRSCSLIADFDIRN